MAINTEWDVDKYRTEHDLDHHWDIKKKFIEANKDKFPEDQLLGLANCFFNIEVLGCRYDEKLMKRIQHLAAGLYSERIEKEKQKFSEGFVPASNAASERVKAKLNPVVQIHNKDEALKPSQFVQGGSLSTVKLRGDLEPELQGKRPLLDQGYRVLKRPSNENQYHTEGLPRKQPIAIQRELEEARRLMSTGPFGRLVIFENYPPNEGAVGILERTAVASQITTNYSFSTAENKVVCQLSLGGLFLASADGSTQKAAKDATCRLALKQLKQTSFTVQVKSPFSTTGVEVSKDLKMNLQGGPVHEKSHVDKPISQDNLGCKMMKLMGWAGGALGKDEQGIDEPIPVYEQNITRTGLGLDGNLENFRIKVRQLLEDFVHSDSKEDLIFSPEFSKDERKLLHTMVHKYNLKSRSYGKEEGSRRLVVFKRVSPTEIVEELILSGRETDKYKLISPQPS